MTQQEKLKELLRELGFVVIETSQNVEVYCPDDIEWLTFAFDENGKASRLKMSGRGSCKTKNDR